MELCDYPLIAPSSLIVYIYIYEKVHKLIKNVNSSIIHFITVTISSLQWHLHSKWLLFKFTLKLSVWAQLTGKRLDSTHCLRCR